MSVSKLECLPNELFLEIFEKNLNGVDILILISCLKKERFHQLIQQIQHWYFDFRYCPKDSFYCCLHFPLVNFVEKIEELFLSDENAPDQIQHFLSYFGSFAQFKRLRKLYLHVNFHSVNWSITHSAICSLSETPIETISFGVTNAEKDTTFGYIVKDIIGLTTIKRFSFTSDAQHSFSFPITNHSSTLEYLTYYDRACDLEKLPYIFQCCSQLKHLNIQITSKSYLQFNLQIYLLSANNISIPTLHTLILSFMPQTEVTMETLAQYLRMTPALQRLEIKANNTLLNANAWENLLQTSLPLLTHFRLKSTTSRVSKNQIDGILASFETPFWIGKNNFYLIITEHKMLDSSTYNFSNRLFDDRDEFLEPVTRWWIVPARARIDDIPTKDIIHIGITDAFKYLSDYYQFKNIKYLVIYNLDPALFECLNRCVNSFGIEHLDVSHFDHVSFNTIIPLLVYLKNITSLRIQYQHLLAYRTIYFEKSNELKHLDISVDDHSFSTDDILTISQLFPKLERLAINTEESLNISLLKTSLPHLRTLTFRIIHDNFGLPRNRVRMWNNLLRQKVKFSFRIHDEWMTVWIDEAAFEDPYWQRSVQQANITSN